MPSWNEKRHVVPTINVNLKPCDAARRPGWQCPHTHCAAKPVPIPCPIPPTVEFKVVLGECTCCEDDDDGPLDTGADYRKVEILRHADDCPALPVSVTCTISGETWARSGVADAELAHRSAADHATLSEPMRMAAITTCNARWALVKALVLDTKTAPDRIPNHWRPTLEALFAQRDAVFAALADMARAEESMLDAQIRARKAINHPHLTARETPPADRPSAQALGIFVERLIEQVGILVVAS